MKTLCSSIMISVLYLLLISNHLFNVDARCMTDANGNVIGNCSSPPSASSSVSTTNQSTKSVEVPVVLYLLVIVSISCGGASLYVMKKMK